MPSLYVTEQGARLETEAGRLLVVRQDLVLASVPASRVSQVVIVGNAGVTTPALNLLLERQVSLVFLTTSGAFRGRLSGDLSGNVDLRRQQYARLDDARFCCDLGRSMIAGKVRNSRTLILRLDTSNTNPVALKAADGLRQALSPLQQATTREELMGIEGQAAKVYFRAFSAFLRPPWVFSARKRRPPPDPVNALLSLLYTLLHESCYAALETVALDPYCGYLHRPHYGRASLAVDLMEEFRPVIADSVVLTLLNKRMLHPEEFRYAGDGGCFLEKDGWHKVAEQYARRMQTRIRLPGADRQTTYQKLLEVQARQLRRVITGDAGHYAPFLIK